MSKNSGTMALPSNGGNGRRFRTSRIRLRKKRMLKAGLGEGLDFPEDWNTLSEDEKEIRLNKVVALAGGKE